ncbi:TetR/AcrR family transcriptional regulator [Tardiphaga sp.]|uniref:TetR/AcrR family transcriptional regulator n=1 Tax=Tardiphaga sp. TaxID=1926292 RepID=UPI00263924DD|nr:TetR/AcrR family transcriptional regulator [Tardiphaga sp.]MDB5619905.1 DNA-binding transcriptional regulator, AcrR family [Tardiphaga sp.]
MAKPRGTKPKEPSRAHDLKPIVRLQRVNAPKQARSEQRLQDIVLALEELLDGRTFEEITIPDIAARAGCVPASIYARFRDKASILVALHESTRDRQMTNIDESMRLERHEHLSLEESIFKILRNLTRYYSRQRNLLRPAYLLGDTEIYERASDLIRHVTERISAIVRHRLKDEPAEVIDQRVELAMRSVYALLQQRMVFQGVTTGRFMPANDEEMARELDALFKQIVLKDA